MNSLGEVRVELRRANRDEWGDETIVEEEEARMRRNAAIVWAISQPLAKP